MKKSEIESFLDLDLKDIEVHASNIWKMAWEQVLLLAIYSRKSYYEEDSFSFHQRMRLIDKLESMSEAIENRRPLPNNRKEAFDDKKAFGYEYYCILKKIENNSGSNDILKYLLDDTDDSAIKRKIREEIEKGGIAFPASSKKDLHYSYYSLYKSLKDFIPIFQAALSYSEPEEGTIRSLFYKTVADFMHENRVGQGIIGKSLDEAILEPQISDEEYVHKNTEKLKILTSSYTLKAKNELISKFYNNLITGYVYINQEGEERFSEGLGAWASRVLNLTAYTKNQEEFQPGNFYKLESKNSNIDIEINQDKLKELMSLGLLDALFAEIASKSKSLISQSIEGINPDLEANKNTEKAFEKISEWYAQNKTTLFIRSNQIPKLLAYLLNFDLEYKKGLFDSTIRGITVPNYGPSSVFNSNKPSERYLQVSMIMKYCFHYKKNLRELYFKSNDNPRRPPEIHYMDTVTHVSDTPKVEEKSRKDQIIDFINNLEVNSSEQLNSNLVEPWITFTEDSDYNKMLNRFKRMPKYLKDGYSLNLMIKNQKYQLSTMAPVTYPFSLKFPLPLWVTKLNISDT